jgi:hypothetical protein
MLAYRMIDDALYRMPASPSPSQLTLREYNAGWWKFCSALHNYLMFEKRCSMWFELDPRKAMFINFANLWLELGTMMKLGEI